MRARSLVTNVVVPSALSTNAVVALCGFR